MRVQFFIVFFTGVLWLIPRWFVHAQTFQNSKVKNVILLIADGGGIGHITAGMYANEGDFTNYQRMKYIGLHKQHSGSHLITDSGAGATAFSCGVKSYNHAIGVDIDTLPVKTILEEAEERGLTTGLVATSTIVHATPASFIAHVAHRKMYEDIAEQFTLTDIDYFVGGGMKYFVNREKDNRSIIEELEEKGYVIETYLEKDFDRNFFSYDRYGFLTAAGSPLPHSQGREYLEPASIYGIEFLHKKNDNGFFMMIEGSQVDWGGHANDGAYLIDEMQEFDRVVGSVLDWAEKDGETLVVVTGDHECGGLALSHHSRRDSIVTNFASDYHTGEMIPVFAYGPKAELFQGIYQNTDIYHKMRQALGWEEEK